MPLRILISFASIKLYSDAIKTFNRAVSDGCEIFIDSGAFSNFTKGQEVVTIEEYMAFLDKHHDSIWRYINFDVLGDAVKTQQNYEYLLSKGYNPVPVLTYGNSISEVKRFQEGKDYFCIGNIARSNTTVKDKSIWQYSQIGVNINKSHLLGVSNPRIIWKYKPYSFDSSTHLMCGINGNMYIYNHLKLSAEQINEAEAYDVYDHYVSSHYNGVDRWIVSSCEALKFSRDAEKWGSKMFFVVARMKDYEVLKWGEELYLKNVA